MSEDEANMWLSRLNEERRDREKKRKQANQNHEVEKDW